MTLRRLLLLTLLSVLAPQVSAYEVVQSPAPDDPLGAHIYRLDNGLTVYLTENHETPRFYAEIVVRAGSKHDPAESTGLAHYLEHMLFKGTAKLGTVDYESEKVHLDRITELYEIYFHETDPDKRKGIYADINAESQKAASYAAPNEIGSLYTSMGGTALNAHTHYEETVYRVDLPSNRLEQWAIIESERMGNAVFRLFQPELEIVYEEMNRTLDSKERLINFAVDSLLFKVHPYGQQPTIGKVDHLKNPSLANMYEFYQTWYVPNNMAIVISGDIDPGKMIDVIESHFSAWEAKPLPELPTWTEEPLKGAERVEVTYEGEEFVMLAFRMPSREHPDAEALELLDEILYNKKRGIIDLNLNQQQRVRQAGSSRRPLNDAGSVSLWGIPKAGQSLEEVEGLLLEQLEIVKRGEFDQALLDGIATDYKKIAKALTESNSGRVRLMREAFLWFQEWDHARRYIDRTEKITKDDIVRVANQYFGLDYVAGYRKDAPQELPDIEKPQIDKIDIDLSRQSQFYTEVAQMPADSIEPHFVQQGKDYTKSSYANGVDFYHAPNPFNDLFTLTFSVDVGTNHDNRLGMARRLLDKSGAGDLSAAGLKKEWFRLGTGFSASAGSGTSSFTISGLDENFETSLALMMKVIGEPAASDSVLAGLVDIVLSERADAVKNHQTIMGGVVLQNRWGDDSRYLKVLPNDALGKLTVSELHGLLGSLLDYQHTIRYTGSLPPEQILATLGKHHLIESPLREPPPFPFYKARTPDVTEIHFFDKEIAQSQVYFEIGDIDFDESRMPEIELFNGYIGSGLDGIFFQQLREARALAYSTGARYSTGDRADDQNTMWGYIMTQGDKTVEAVSAFIELLDHLPQTSDMFDKAKQSVLNEYRTSRIGFRGLLGKVQEWERLEVPIDPREKRFQAIQEADVEDVLRFYRQRIQNRVKLISIVGPRKQIDMEALAQLGTVVDVGLEEIFGF